jgi:predicted MFS family arabinose efflux permease
MSRGLRALLLAEIISTTGSQLTGLAIPWFVLTTTGSAARAGVIAGLELAGIALGGLPGGVLVARLGSRRAMVLADLVRAPLVALIPLLYWAGALHFGVLAVLVLAVSLFWMPYSAGQQTVLPALTGDDPGLLNRANALYQGANRTTALVGPVCAGVLITALGGAAPVLLIDGVSYLCSAAVIGLLVPAVRAEGRPAGVRAGLRFIARDPIRRNWIAGFMFSEAGWQVLFLAIPVLVVTAHHADARIAGLMIAAWGGAAVLGALTSYRLSDRVTPLTMLRVTKPLQALVFLALLAPVPLAGMTALLAAAGLVNGLTNPAHNTLQQLTVPAEVRPQVGAVMSTVSILGGAVGMFAGGALMQAHGVRTALAVAALGQLAGTVLLMRGSRYVQAALRRATPVMVTG